MNIMYTDSYLQRIDLIPLSDGGGRGMPFSNSCNTPTDSVSQNF